MKHNSPQLGFNNNVRHRGRVFHIQTEDSGVKHPHIITHLFADGGRILKSTKTSYAEFLGEEELSKKVRSLMQEQHKAMFIALRAGKFDHQIGEAPEPGADAPAESTPAISLNGGAMSAPAPRAPMPSLTGATEFAKADAPAPPTASQVAPAVAAAPPVPMQPAPSRPATPIATPPPPSGVIQPGRPKSNSAMAHAETMATMPAVADQGVEAAPAAPPPAAPPPAAPPAAARSVSPRTGSIPPSGLTQEPPRARLTPPPPRNAEPMLSPLRALGARPSPPHAYPAPGTGGSPGNAARPTASASAQQPAARADKPAARAPSVPPPGARPPVSASLDLDLEALERAAEQSQVPVYQQIRDLPPPPSSLLKPSAPRNTSYRSVTPQATQIVDPKAPGAQPAPAAPQPAPPPRGAPTIPRAPASNRGSSSRYAPSRPASIFGSSRPQEGSSIFGEDLISEKSLDEVILSYLAEDLEGGTPKK